MSQTTARDLGDGIGQVPIPIPFRGLDWVNAYAIADDDGLTLIDCGVFSDDGHDALVSGLRELGHDLSSLHTLVVSHLHPDHVGLAPRLIEETGCRFIMHERADLGLRILNHPEHWGPSFASLAADHGAPPDLVTVFEKAQPTPDWWHLVDPPHETVRDGDHILIGGDRRLEVLYTPGHEIAHICLKDSTSDALFSGDHVLPRITPYIGYEDPERDPNPLGHFLQSLQRIADGRHGITYPAHGDIIERGWARAEQILLHHERRLDDTLTEIITPATAWQVMEGIFRPNLDLFHKRLALRETLSHLEYLRFEHQARRDLTNRHWFYRKQR